MPKRIDIDHLTYAELVDLNHRVVERLKFLDQMKAHAEMLEFRIGERVQFPSKDGRMLIGIIAKYNKKTVTIVTEAGEQWRVSPEFLSGVEATQRSDSNVVPIGKPRKST